MKPALLMIRVIARAVRTLRCAWAWPPCVEPGTVRVGGGLYCPTCAERMRAWAREAG